MNPALKDGEWFERRFDLLPNSDVNKEPPLRW
jgi:hypothetical protein